MKADAIVVSEPKQLAVPEFNKKEIVGVVNEGISSGQVQIPAGGTKLYKHAIRLQAGASTFRLEAIHNKSDSINSIVKLVGFITESPIVVSTEYGIFYAQRFEGYSGHYFSYYIQTIYNNDGTLELKESSDMVSSDITDTITEL